MKQEKERILKLVEDGMLTAQEALTLIEKLDHEYKEKKSRSPHYLRRSRNLRKISKAGQKEAKSRRSGRSCSTGLILPSKSEGSGS